MDRLHKVMAQAGVASRRKAEEMILEGRVEVNGQVVTHLGLQVAPTDIIKVDNQVIGKPTSFVYYLFNKPRNTLATLADDRGRPTISQYIGDIKERVFPMGRLDFMTSGALLLTNDGQLTQSMSQRKTGLDNSFVVLVTGSVNEDTLAQLASEPVIEEVKYPPIKVTKMKYDSTRHTTVLLMSFQSSKDVSFKSLLGYYHHGVLMVRRDAIEGLTVYSMEPGTYRPLTANEIDRIKTKLKKLPQK